MARQIRKTWVIVLVAVLTGLIAVCGAILLVDIYLCYMRDLGLHSEMSFLNAAIRDHLQQYFEQEDHYPDSLDMVTQSILDSYQKNADQPKILSWLSCFHYSSTGDTYILTWSLNKYGNLWTNKEYGKNGAFVKWEVYVDGKLHNKGKMK
jgi:hypothetical protein